MERDTGADALQLGGLAAREALVRVTRVLDAAGVEGAARDARILLLTALGIDGTELVRNPERPLQAPDASRLAEFAHRRAGREPVSRIVGERGFYGRSFRITPATLDPRPCTETVVEAALEVVGAEGWREKPIRILDIGTGSGALLVTLLAELPRAIGVGTDISDGALAAALDNAERLAVAARATFLKRDLLQGLEGPFDLVVSNPPYIPTSDIATLDPEVRVFDPWSALDGGADGLDLYRALAQGLRSVMPSGWILVEVGAGQAEDVAAILRSAAGGAVSEIKLWTDLGHHTRCVAARTQFVP